LAIELYLLSGLGADRRVFNFLDLHGFELIFIDWIKPLKDETIESYARRLLVQIKSTRPTLIGVSFGGIIAIEIAKLVETNRVILVSSATTKGDIPARYRLAGNLLMNKLIPGSFYRKANFVVYWLFGVKKKKEKDLLKAIMDDADNDFVDWATKKIADWDNERLLPNVITIHGTADRVLPFRKADYIVHNGGHLMVVSKAEEVSRILRTVLEM
jgi:pimeloyl-ACP methyl ester carboxylesterase